MFNSLIHTVLFLVCYLLLLMAPHVSAGYRAILQFEPSSRPPGMRPGLDTSTDDDVEQLMLNIGGGIVGSLAAVILLGVLIAGCAYCCIVKYKMCTPIPDPIQDERRRSQRRNRHSHNMNTVNNVEQVDNGITDQEQPATTEEEQSAVAPIVNRTYDNSELIIRPPPGYIEGRFYPFTPVPLPSYDTIYSSSTSLSGLEYTHHAISTYATAMRDSGILTNEPGSTPQTPEPAAQQHTSNPAVPNNRTSTVDVDVIANPSVTEVHRRELPRSETESSVEGEELGEVAMANQQSNTNNITTDNDNNNPSAVPVMEDELSIVIANSNANTGHVQPAGEIRDHEELPTCLSRGSFSVHFGGNSSSSESEDN